MRNIKIVFGLMLLIGGGVEFIRVVGMYLTLPAGEWPVGAEIGTFIVCFIGFSLVRSGLKHPKTNMPK